MLAEIVSVAYTTDKEHQENTKDRKPIAKPSGSHASIEKRPSFREQGPDDTKGQRND
jgi:hypothetical protein